MMKLPLVISFTHYGARTLQRFAGDELTSARRRRVAAHLVVCRRCREQVAFARALMAAASSLPAPAAPTALLSRVLEGRAAGERVILPVVGETPRPRVARWSTSLTAIAASIVVAAIVATHVTGVRGRAGLATVEDSLPTLSSVMTSIGVFPSSAYGQEAPNVNATIPIDEIDGSAIRPLTLAYEFTVTADSEPLQKSERGITTITGATYQSLPAWRVTNRWLGHASDIAETTYVDRRTLRPFARVAHNVGPSRFIVEQRFTGDSLLGTMRTRERSRPLARALPPSSTVGPWLVGEGMPVALLLAVKLRSGWRGGAVIVGWGGVRSDLTYPIELAVEGDERIIVPAGTFDCWRLSLVDRHHELTMWVRKSDQLTVMSRDTSRTPGQLRQVVLLSARPLR
jgi:hypothetical protein